MFKKFKADLGEKLQYLAFEYFKAVEEKNPKADDMFRKYERVRSEKIRSLED